MNATALITDAPPLAALTLAAPWLLAAGGLVVLPIVAHLVARAAGRKIEFPSLMLLQASTTDAARAGRPWRWWLLLLRCLAVVLIVLGFSQPLWWTPRQAEQARGVTSIVLDTSASVQQRSAGLTAFEQVRSDALKQLPGSGSGSGSNSLVDVILAGPDAAAALPRPTRNAAVARDAIANAQPTVGRADLAAAIALARQRAAAGDVAVPARVWVLTDAQASSVNDDELGEPGQTAATLLPVVTGAAAGAGNVALHSPRTMPTQPRAGLPLTLQAALTNHQDRAATVRVFASSAGIQSDPVAVRLAPRTTAAVAIDWPNELTEGIHTFRLALAQHNDALPLDDAVYLVARALPRPRVLLVTPDQLTPGQKSDPRTARYFLRRSLQPRPDEANPFDVRVVTLDAFEPSSLAAADSVVVHRPDLLRDAQAQPLRGFVASGGGLVLLADAATLRASWMRDADWLPLELESEGEPGRESGRWVDTPDPGTRWRATAEQPTAVWQNFLSLREAGIRAAIDGLRLPGYRDAALRAGGDAVLQTGSGTPVLARRSVERGSVVMLCAPLAPRRSDLLRAAAWVPLLHTMVDDTLGQAALNPPASAGGPAMQTVRDRDWPGIDSSNSARPTVTAPDGTLVHDAQLTRTPSGWQWMIPRADQLGVYTLAGGGRVIDRLAVNLDPRESDLTPADPRWIAAYNAATRANENETGGAINVAASPLPGVAGEPAAGATELWGWLILLGAIALGLEMALLARWGA